MINAPTSQKNQNKTKTTHKPRTGSINHLGKGNESFLFPLNSRAWLGKYTNIPTSKSPEL